MLAEKLFTDAPQVDTPSVMGAAYRTLGFVYEAKQQWDDAAKALHTAARLMPQWSYVHEHLGMIYARQVRWAEAAAELETAVRLRKEAMETVRPTLAMAHYQVGLGLFQQKKLVAAAREFERAALYLPSFAPAHHYLGISYAALHQWEKAAEAIDAAVRADANEPLARSNLGRVQARQQPVPPVIPHDEGPR